jgi:hypothetical protein
VAIQSSSESIAEAMSFLNKFVCECPNEQISKAIDALVTYWLANDTDAPRLDALAQIKNKLSNDEIVQVSWLLAINPNTPPSILQDLCCDAEVGVAHRIAENSAKGYAAIADTSYQAIAEIRIASAANKRTPMASILLLVKDESLDLRYSLAENHSLPVEALQILAQDDNPFVKFRAEKTIDRLEPSKVIGPS